MNELNPSALFSTIHERKSSSSYISNLKSEDFYDYCRAQLKVSRKNYYLIEKLE
jgi:hypothetical protein